MANEMNLIPQDDYIAACNAIRKLIPYDTYDGHEKNPMISSDLAFFVNAFINSGNRSDGTISFATLSPGEVESYAFYKCTYLWDVFGVNEVTSVGEYAFFDTHINSNTARNWSSLIRVGRYAFACSLLAYDYGTAYFPKLENIPEYCFSNRRFDACYFDSIAGIDINGCRNCRAEKMDFAKLKNIGADGFLDCINLKTLIIRTPTVCTLSNATCFVGTPILKGTGYIYVPKALIEQYKTAPNWSPNYTNQFRAIEDYPDIVNS